MGEDLQGPDSYGVLAPPSFVSHASPQARQRADWVMDNLGASPNGRISTLEAYEGILAFLKHADLIEHPIVLSMLLSNAPFT